MLFQDISNKEKAKKIGSHCKETEEIGSLWHAQTLLFSQLDEIQTFQITDLLSM